MSSRDRARAHYLAALRAERHARAHLSAALQAAARSPELADAGATTEAEALWYDAVEALAAAREALGQAS